MNAAYGDTARRWWQPVSDGGVVLLAAATATGVVLGVSAQFVVTIGVVVALVAIGPRFGARPDLALLIAVVASCGAWASDRAWREVAPDRLGPYTGWARVASDPRPVAGSGSALSVVLEIEGERFQVYAYGSARRRLGPRRVGERVEVVATRAPLRGHAVRRTQARHVVGRAEIERVGAVAPGSALETGINRLRERLATVADRTMGDEDASLFSGLVIGDDSRQSASMLEAFRRSGLSHLTAVSGQNVALIVASAGVVLRRLPSWWRLVATWALIAWFVLLTRAEPSVVRAGAMAACSAGAFTLGRAQSSVRILGLAVTVLVLVDPLLVWSVGFWLSVTATLGVTVAAPWIGGRLAGPVWLTAPLSVTLGAQIGVLLPSWLVFGRLPVLGVPANLLAVAVAGAVMLVGMPLALAASVLPAVAADVVMIPAELGTRWVARVAALAARLEPAGIVEVVVWVAQGAVVALLVLRARTR